ncbi:MAG: flagellar hook-basal body complex protein [Phycisphaeraceae bacterium]|nr:flagellar hook-basal body complex protein [Phycisphaeraceae bacterium]
MASTVALFSALSGLNAHARSLDVIGNNIANVNTTAFKSSRAVFADLFSRTISGATPPTETSGGTNPSQVGFGVRIAATQRDMGTGTISPTGNVRDLAIDGNGFFIVERNGDERFTRAGNFQFDADQNLVTVDGDRVLGYGVDAGFTVQSGALVPLNIPLGQLRVAEATSEVRLTGNLNASGALPVGGSVLDLGATPTSGFGLITGATVPPTAPNVLETTSLLTEIADPADPDAPLFAQGQQFTIEGARKGNLTLPTERLAITAATTVADLMAFIAAVLGIVEGDANPDGLTPGVALDPLTGRLSITGNTGSVHDLEIEPTDFVVRTESGAFLRFPMSIEKLASASGESVRTTTVAFDSLGQAVELDVALVLIGRGDTGTLWRYDVSSADDSNLGIAITSGVIAFDTRGQLMTTEPVQVLLDRSGTGAATPLAISLGFAGAEGGITALADQTSRIAASYRDGAPMGTLEEFGIDRDGVIYGAFSNTMVRPLGQLALAVFTNPEGLSAMGGNLYRPGANSGPPAVTTPGMLGSGAVVAGALELSNVDIGREFINMVLASTGYNASSRVIQTTNDLLDRLLAIR